MILIKWLRGQGMAYEVAREETVALLNKYDLKDIERSFTKVTTFAAMKAFLNQRLYKRSTLPKFNENGIQIA